MAKFLDKDGLSHFWGKIKSLLSGKADQTSLDNTNSALARVDATVGGEDSGLVAAVNLLETTIKDKADKSSVSQMEININQQLEGKSNTDHTHDAATTSKNGFMTSTMVTKLNGIAEGANKTIVDDKMSDTSTNPVQNKVVNGKIAILNAFMEETVPITYVKKENVDGSYSETSTNPIQNKVVAASISNLNKFMLETVPGTYAKKTDIATAYKPMGSVATIPSIGDMDGGEVYNITAEFTTTTDFVEGAGKKYPAGTNIVLTSDKKWDVLAGFVDLTPYATSSAVSEIQENLQNQIDDIEAVTGSIDTITNTEIDTMMTE